MSSKAEDSNGDESIAKSNTAIKVASGVAMFTKVGVHVSS